MNPEIYVQYWLPRNVVMLKGVLYQNMEIDDGYPEGLQCIAETTRGKRCKNILEPMGGMLDRNYPIEVDGLTMYGAVATGSLFTPQRVGRWQFQICQLHHARFGDWKMASVPGWKRYDTTNDVAKLRRVLNRVEDIERECNE